MKNISLLLILMATAGAYAGDDIVVPVEPVVSITGPKKVVTQENDFFVYIAGGYSKIGVNATPSQRLSR